MGGGLGGSRHPPLSEGGAHLKGKNAPTVIFKLQATYEPLYRIESWNTATIYSNKIAYVKHNNKKG